MRIVRDLLDNQILDCYGKPLGRVDGIVLELRDGLPPRVVAVRSGSAVLARRFGASLERLVRWLIRLLHLPAAVDARIEWDDIRYIGIDVKTNEMAETSDLFRSERSVRQRIIRRIAGALS